MSTKLLLDLGGIRGRVRREAGWSTSAAGHVSALELTLCEHGLLCSPPPPASNGEKILDGYSASHGFRDVGARRVFGLSFVGFRTNLSDTDSALCRSYVPTPQTHEYAKRVVKCWTTLAVGALPRLCTLRYTSLDARSLLTVSTIPPPWQKNQTIRFKCRPVGTCSPECGKSWGLRRLCLSIIHGWRYTVMQSCRVNPYSRVQIRSRRSI